MSFQVRWKVSKRGVDLDSVLSTYFDRLRRDAKSAKKGFQSDVEEKDGILLYRYASEHFGRGAILQAPSSGRVFFLEAISTKNDSLIPTFRKLLDSFLGQNMREAASVERWALFGLDVTLPIGLEVEKKLLQSGRTELTLVNKQARIEANRWGLAEQLVAKHGLEPWAKSVLRVPNAVTETSAEGILLTVPGSLLKKPQIGMARVQSDRNQIATVMVSTRHTDWRPSWDWFN